MSGKHEKTNRERIFETVLFLTIFFVAVAWVSYIASHAH
jgi:hypothetical protein